MNDRDKASAAIKGQIKLGKNIAEDLADLDVLDATRVLRFAEMSLFYKDFLIKTRLEGKPQLSVKAKIYADVLEAHFGGPPTELGLVLALTEELEERTK